MDTNKQTLHWTPVTVKMQLGHLCTCVPPYKRNQDQAYIKGIGSFQGF